MTFADKIEKSKFRRSQALMSKINILWTRDGNATLGIEAASEVDKFNCKQLFGSSGTETIDYSHMGVEGLIRCYYHISYLLKGTRRDNILRSNNYSIPSYCACKDASLEYATDCVLAGTPESSGFFYPNSSTKSGQFKTENNCFRSNKSTTSGDSDEDALYGIFDDLYKLIGIRSPLGTKTFSSMPSIDDLMYEDQMLGKRNSDLYPYSYYSTQTGSTGGSGGSGGTPTYSYTYTFGNGTYDTENQSVSYGMAYSGTPNYWDANWTTEMNNVVAKIDEVIAYINYTKISDTTYFINPKIIPGYNSWGIQTAWINKLMEVRNAITGFIALLNQHYPFEGNTSRTDPLYKSAIDAALDSLRSTLDTGKTYVNAIHDEINPAGSNITNLGAGFFGNPDDNGATLWGARTQWIKSILDVNDGSRVTLKGIAAVINSMNASLTRAEEEYVLIGIDRQSVSWASSTAWIGGIATPDILEIEYHQAIDTDATSDTYLELINDGYIVSWTATAHATGYDLWRSLNWDGTKGTWVKLLAAGNSFSVQDINPNNGQVYNFYTDLSVDPSTTKPYYKVKSYDSGGSGDYSRIPSCSEESAPKNIDDFDGSGSGNTNNGVVYPPSGGTGSSGGSSTTDGSTTTYTYGAVTWREPVLNFALLPVTGNRAGDVRLVIAEKTLYYWNSDVKEWDTLTGSSSEGGSSWKDPVETQSFLPTINNSDGDVRLVLSEGKLYRWDSEEGLWSSVESDSQVSISHTNLSDMPDANGMNSDHDKRYYTHEEVDTKVEKLSEQLDVLKYLIPSNSAPLSGELTLVGRTYSSGYLSHGYSDQQRFDTLRAEQYFTKIIKGGSIILESALSEKEFNNADKGVLLLYINGAVVDSFDLVGNFDESKRTSAQTYTPKKSNNGHITVTYVGMYLSYSLYQRGSYQLSLDSSVLATGENSIKLVHSYNSTEDSTPTLTIFYDPSNDAINLTNFDIRQNKIISSKYLSGLRYYGLNDALNISFKASKLFNNTYIMPNQVSIDSSELAIAPYTISHESAGSTYVDFGQPFINAILASDEVKILTEKNVITASPTIRAKGFNLNTSNEFTYSEKVLINTYATKSTDTSEYFVDEMYRLPVDVYDSSLSTYKNIWKSNAVIGSADLQVFSGALIYPRTDYTLNYLPAQTSNYSGLSGDRCYIRAFHDTNPHTNGLIYIKGYDAATCPYIKVEIKLPGKTGWMSLSSLYNEATFTGSDADGCLVNQDQNYYQYTTGAYSTADSGYMVLVKVTMTSNNYVSIGEISIIW